MSKEGKTTVVASANTDPSAPAHLGRLTEVISLPVITPLAYTGAVNVPAVTVKASPPPAVPSYAVALVKADKSIVPALLIATEIAKSWFTITGIEKVVALVNALNVIAAVALVNLGKETVSVFNVPVMLRAPTVCKEGKEISPS